MTKKKKGKREKPKWTPFEPAVLPERTAEDFQKTYPHISEEDAKQSAEKWKQQKVFMNHLYQVNVMDTKLWDKNDNQVFEVVHLSIKRRDKHPIHDWRHFQRIKNELVGEQYEGIELYPVESRRVDAANQYHLWVVKDPTFRFPFGFQERMVEDDVGDSGAKQRKFEENPQKGGD